MLTEDFEQNRPKAEVVSGGLVLSFPNAVTPIVWRHSLDKMDDVSFQLLYEGNICILAIKIPSGHLKEVARFASRDEGRKAMQLATDALFSGGGFLGASDKAVKNTFFSLGNLLVLILLAAVIGGGIWFHSLPPADDMMSDVLQSGITDVPDPAAQESAVNNAGGEQQMPQQENPQDSLASGKPVDADALFAR